jgi:hypothetical protein
LRCRKISLEDALRLVHRYAEKQSPKFERPAMRDALRAYLGFAGANSLAWAPHLSTEKRLFVTQP